MDLKKNKKALIIAGGITTAIAVGAVAGLAGGDEQPSTTTVASQGDNSEDSQAAAQDGEGEEYVRVCVNQDTNERVDDAECPADPNDPDDTTVVNNYHSGGSPLLTALTWYYIGKSMSGPGAYIPAVGQTMANVQGTTTKPVAGTIAKNVSKDSRPFSESYRSSSKVGYVSDGKTFSSKASADAARTSKSGTSSGSGTKSGSTSGDSNSSNSSGSGTKSGSTSGDSNSSNSSGSGTKSGGFGSSGSSSGSKGSGGSSGSSSSGG